MAGEEKWAWRVIDEVEKAVVGKRDILTKIMTAILAGGHILIEDIPGTGKTTMALAFSRAMGLEVKRVQFTPDVLPSDLTGFTVYQKETGKFVYQPGAAICNLLLADEINRTSPKTQSALLEVMEEQQVTVDGVTRDTGNPFIVIATENPAGSAGTQLLPESQLDRFMICVSMGYPTLEEEMKILRRSQGSVQAGERITDSVEPILDAASLLQLRKNAGEVFVHELIYRYIAELAQATRENEWVELGLSPRGTVALTAMAKARAYLKGRAFVIPADVAEVFPDVASHRLILNMKAKVGHIRTDELIRQVIESVPQPSVKKRR
ncbi:MAG TPA: MoxR family ATPase [Candidatus Mediterraneibacter faecigallinarum]|uniref:MoxR family ATPase n=1 Tax=Candidatus Mediterraneibacter faecigallinarum TaxID=2838669 RepID=A0A9D2SYF7_9FIRM|nr:MoxR family ATPase [Candidatus Mediterraneibacter faecigallinarum]